MEYCRLCSKQIDSNYLINCLGEKFCSDECYDEYYEQADIQVVDDDSHPYFDDYRNMRRIYINWVTNWEKRLICLDNYQMFEMDDILDEIDEDIWKFKVYIFTEGDDGAFSREIYLYTIKLQELQQKILKWRPQREIYYCIAVNVDEKILFSKLKDLEKLEFEEFKKNQHPFREDTFVFEDCCSADYAKEQLLTIFTEDDLYLHEAFRCEGGCGDIIDIGDVEDQDGWAFCCSCEDKVPGIFSREELEKELAVYDSNPDLLQHDSRLECWRYFTRKVKRSCRVLNRDFPDWINIGD